MGKSGVNIKETENQDNEMQVGEAGEAVADKGMEGGREGGRWAESVKSWTLR